MPCVNKDSFTFSFPILNVFYFFLLFYFTDLNLQCDVEYKRKSEHPGLAPDFGVKAFSLSSLSMRIAVDFSYTSFIRLSKFPYVSSLFRVFSEIML